MELLVLIWLVVLTAMTIVEAVYIHFLSKIVEGSLDVTHGTLNLIQGILGRIRCHEEEYHNSVD